MSEELGEETRRDLKALASNGNAKWVVLGIVALFGGGTGVGAWARQAMGGSAPAPLSAEPSINKELIEYRLTKLEEGQSRIEKLLEDRLPKKGK